MANRVLKLALHNGLLVLASAAPFVLAADLNSAMNYFQNKQYQAAASAFDQAAAKDPSDARALYYAALSYHYARSYDEAKKRYQQVIAKFPGTTQAEQASKAIRAWMIGNSNTAGATTHTTTKSPPDQQATIEGPGESRIYFSRQSGVMLVESELNGRRLPMIFDTGCEVTALGKNHLRQLGLPLPNGAPSGYAQGVGSANKIPTWNISVTIKIGSITRKNFLINVQEEMPGVPLLGQNFFDSFQYTIDNGDSSIHLKRTTSTVSRHNSSYDVPFSRLGKELVVNALVNGKPCPMIFDTGASQCSFPLKTIHSLGLHIPEDAQEGLSEGIGGITRTHSFPINRIQLGPIDKSNIVVHIPELHSMPLPLLGQNFYSDWQYTIDYQAKVIHFVRR